MQTLVKKNIFCIFGAIFVLKKNKMKNMHLFDLFASVGDIFSLFKIRFSLTDNVNLIFKSNREPANK